MRRKNESESEYLDSFWLIPKKEIKDILKQLINPILEKNEISGSLFRFDSVLLTYRRATFLTYLKNG